MTHWNSKTAKFLCFIDLSFIRQYTDSLIILGMPPNCNTPWMESWLSMIRLERKGMWQDGTMVLTLGNAFKLHSTSCLIRLKMNWNEFKSLLWIEWLQITHIVFNLWFLSRESKHYCNFTKQIIKFAYLLFFKSVMFICSCCDIIQPLSHGCRKI